MRTFLAILASVTVLSTAAQTHQPAAQPAQAAAQFFSPLWQPFFFTPGPVGAIDFSNRRLQLRPYASIDAGVIVSHGAATYVSAPMGLMLARPLNNNWAAFASASVAPTVFSMNRLYNGPMQSPFAPNRYGVNVNAAVQAGLIYTNDAKTFSISGSVILERGSYPVYTPSNRANTHPAPAY
jgi:hypothetical protein